MKKITAALLFIALTAFTAFAQQLSVEEQKIVSYIDNHSVDAEKLLEKIVNIESPIEVQVSVKDVTGKTVYEAKLTKQVDLSKFADGVYLFTISDKEGNELIKQQRVTKFTSK